MLRCAQKVMFPTPVYMGGRVGMKFKYQNKFLLGITSNVQNYREKSCLPTLYPLGWGQLQNQIFLDRIKQNVQICRESHVPQLPPFWECMWGSIHKKERKNARNWMKCLGLQRKIMFAISLPSWGGGHLTKIFFPWNWMKYPVLHRKFVCHPTTHHGVKVSTYNFIC